MSSTFFHCKNKMKKDWNGVFHFVRAFSLLFFLLTSALTENNMHHALQLLSKSDGLNSLPGHVWYLVVFLCARSNYIGFKWRTCVYCEGMWDWSWVVTSVLKSDLQALDRTCLLDSLTGAQLPSPNDCTTSIALKTYWLWSPSHCYHFIDVF